jgi:hypothetical protein
MMNEVIWKTLTLPYQVTMRQVLCVLTRDQNLIVLATTHMNQSIWETLKE